MSKIITITNQKGGVGKTATAVNTAKALSDKGFRVLLIDLDPQRNASKAYGFSEDPEYHICDFLEGENKPIPESRGVHVIPGNKILASFPDYFAGDYSLLKRMIGRMSNEVFSFILIDTPPNLGWHTANAIVASDEVLCVVQPEYEPMEAIPALVQTIDRMNEQIDGCKSRLLGILVAMHVKNLALHKAVLKDIRNHYSDLVFDTTIRRNVSVAEAPGYRLDVISYMPNSPGACDYKKFADELVEVY